MLCTGCFKKLNVTQGLIYEIQLLRGTANNVGFTTKLVNSDGWGYHHEPVEHRLK